MYPPTPELLGPTARDELDPVTVAHHATWPTYEQLLANAQGWLDEAGAGWLQARAGADGNLGSVLSPQLNAELGCVARMLERRRFAAFCARVAPACAVQRGIVDLFCSSRLHRYVLAYMSVQETQDWDTQDTPYPHTASLISQLLARLGKRSLLNVTLRIGPLHWTVAVDPLNPLRSAYVDFLAQHRLTAAGRVLGSLRLRYHITSFSLS